MHVRLQPAQMHWLRVQISSSSVCSVKVLPLSMYLYFISLAEVIAVNSSGNCYSIEVFIILLTIYYST